MVKLSERLAFLSEVFLNAGYMFIVSVYLLNTLTESAFASFTIAYTFVNGARLVLQSLILNQFNLAGTADSCLCPKLAFRFLIYTFGLILVLCPWVLIGLLVWSIEEVTALAVLIALDLLYFYCRALCLKAENRILLFVMALTRLCVTFIGLVITQELLLGYHGAFWVMAASCIAAVGIISPKLKFSYSAIDYESVYRDFFKFGRVQLPLGVISWARVSIPYYALSLAFGAHAVTAFRSVQLLLSPPLMAFSVFESYLPQKLSQKTLQTDAHTLIYKELLLYLLAAPIIISCYLIIIFTTATIFEISIVTDLDIKVVVLFSFFASLVPINSISQIALRYYEKHYYLFWVSLVELLVLTAISFFLINYIGILGFYSYLLLALLLVCSSHVFVLRRIR